LLLLVALTLRVAAHVELPPWSVLLAFVSGVAAADFGSGLVHWSADTWGRADLPVIGPRILWPFRVHHTNPDDFLRRRFLDTNGDVAALVTIALVGLLLMPFDSHWQQLLGVAGLGLCAFGGWTNQIHQWAHMPSPPRAVRLCQRLGLLLRPTDHAAHHDGPYHGHYCITTGWCNRPLEAVRFFRRLEDAVTYVTGALPREDERRQNA
jgi:ubiquitin-conjugating enzyme E2 variant